MSTKKRLIKKQRELLLRLLVENGTNWFTFETFSALRFKVLANWQSKPEYSLRWYEEQGWMEAYSAAFAPEGKRMNKHLQIRLTEKGIKEMTDEHP